MSTKMTLSVTNDVYHMNLLHNGKRHRRSAYSLAALSCKTAVLLHSIPILGTERDRLMGQFVQFHIELTGRIL